MRSSMSVLLLLAACTGEEKPPAGPPAATTCDIGDYPVAYALSAPVRIHRDDRNIPHVYAETDADLFWGAGYQMATERLFEIDTFHRAARGTLSEVRGEEEYVADITARTFDFGRYGCDSVALMAEQRPDDYALLVAYVSGVNARVEEVRSGAAPLPYGFGPGELDYLPETLDLADIVAIGQRINLGYSSTIEYDILYSLVTRLNPSYAELPVFDPGPQRFIVATEGTTGVERAHAAKPPLDWTPEQAERFLDGLARLRKVVYPGEGSNNWAVNPAYTDNGRPYVANDPHSSFWDPNRLYLQHLNSKDAGGSFDVAGFSFAGIPGIQLGHNDRLAWAATTNFSDQTDLYDVAVEDGKANLGGSWLPVSERDETIRVKLADGSYEERVVTVQEVDGHGVILPPELLPEVAAVFARGSVLLAWVGFRPTTEIFMYLDLNRAATLDEFDAAIDLQQVGMHNWVGATADGIRYRTHGLIPDRGPVDGRPQANQILDGSDPSTLWTGAFLDEAHLPRLDGTQPYLVSANNDPWGHTADNDPLNDEFYYASFFSPSFRAERIASELERNIAEGPVTRQDMIDLQLDNHSTLAAGLVPLLEAAAARIDTDEDLADFRGRDDLLAAVARLSAWDRQMDRTSAEAALFRAWQGYVAKRTLSGDLSILFLPVEQASPVTIAKINLLVHQQGIEAFLDGRGAYDLIGGLDDALAWTAVRAGELGVPELAWGDLHRAKVHPTWGAVELLPVDGDESSPNVSPCTFWGESEPEALCVGDEGPIWRTVTGFADDGVPETIFSVAYGNDEISTTEWLDGAYDDFAFRRADVEARTVETLTVAP